MSAIVSIKQRRKTLALLVCTLFLLGFSFYGIKNVHASDPSIGPSKPFFFNPTCVPSTPSTCFYPRWTTVNTRPALQLLNTSGLPGSGFSGAAWHALGYTGTIADVSLDGTYTQSGGIGVADGFTTILFAQNGTGLLKYQNNSIPGLSNPAITGFPNCGVVSSTGIQGGVLMPDSTKQYIALQWDPFYGGGPQFNLWVINPPCTIASNPGSIGCSIGIPAAKDTIRYDVNYTSTGNLLGARVADLTSGTKCSFTRNLTPDLFLAPSPDIYWVMVEGNRGAGVADWSLYTVTITPTEIFGCQEDDANGDFHGQGDFASQNGHKGNFNLNDDRNCGRAVSSTDIGDGTDFQSTAISTVSFNTLANTVTITGIGTHAGVPVTFTFIALETGPTTPGAVSFALSDGYSNTGTLTSGTIILH